VLIEDTDCDVCPEELVDGFNLLERVTHALACAFQIVMVQRQSCAGSQERDREDARMERSRATQARHEAS
jgi:hypothetical protein